MAEQSISRKQQELLAPFTAHLEAIACEVSAATDEELWALRAAAAAANMTNCAWSTYHAGTIVWRLVIEEQSSRRQRRKEAT